MRVDTEEGSGTFELSHTTPSLDLQTTVRWQLDGRSVRYEAETVALADSECARVGICVLLPMVLAGSSALVTGPAGSRRVSIPAAISTATVEAISGIEFRTSSTNVRVDLEGDVFEMEDQRNWADASFKIYSGSVTASGPVQLPAGSSLRQVCHVTVTGARKPPAMASARPIVELSPSPRRDRRRMIGLGARPAGSPSGARFRRLTLDVADGEETTRARMTGFAETLFDGETHYELVIRDIPQNAPWLIAALESLEERPGWILVLDRDRGVTTEKQLPRVRDLRAATNATVGGGAGVSFAQLNYGAATFPSDWLDVVGFPLSSGFHYHDEFTLSSNLAAFSHVVAAGRTMVGDRWLSVSPVLIPLDLGPRYAAAWTTTAMRELLSSDADAIGFQTHRFDGDPGGHGSDLDSPSALADILRIAADPSTEEFVGLVSGSAPSNIAGFALAGHGTVRAFVANLSGRPCRISFVGGVAVRYVTGNEEALVGEPTQSVLELDRDGVAVVDLPLEWLKS